MVAVMGVGAMGGALAKRGREPSDLPFAAVSVVGVQKFTVSGRCRGITFSGSFRSRMDLVDVPLVISDEGRRMETLTNHIGHAWRWDGEDPRCIVYTLASV